MPHKDPEARKAYLKAYAAAHPAYARVKAWREQNPEKRAAQDKAYAEKHPDKVKARQDRYIASNLEQVRIADRKTSARYRAAHPAQVALTKKTYAQQNKGKINAAVAKRAAAKRKQTPGWLTEDDLWLIEQAYDLAAQRTAWFGFMWHVDHVLPLQGRTVSGLHTPLNLRVIPAAHNLSKGNRLEVEHG